MTKVAVQRNSSQFIKINGDFDGKPASQPLAPGAPPVKPLIVSDFFIDNNGFSIEKPLIMSGFGRRLGGCRGCRSGFVSHFARDKAGKEIKLGLFGISPLYI